MAVMNGLVVVRVLVRVRENLRRTDRRPAPVLVAGAHHVVLKFTVVLLVMTGPRSAQVRWQIVARVGKVRTHTVTHGRTQVSIGNVGYHKI